MSLFKKWKDRVIELEEFVRNEKIEKLLRRAKECFGPDVTITHEIVKDSFAHRYDVGYFKIATNDRVVLCVPSVKELESMCRGIEALKSINRIKQGLES